jgi:hypothetical protein
VSGKDFNVSETIVKVSGKTCNVSEATFKVSAASPSGPTGAYLGAKQALSDKSSEGTRNLEIFSRFSVNLGAEQALSDKSIEGTGNLEIFSIINGYRTMGRPLPGG